MVNLKNCSSPERFYIDGDASRATMWRAPGGSDILTSAHVHWADGGVRLNILLKLIMKGYDFLYKAIISYIYCIYFWL